MPRYHFSVKRVDQCTSGGEVEAADAQEAASAIMRRYSTYLPLDITIRLVRQNDTDESLPPFRKTYPAPPKLVAPPPLALQEIIEVRTVSRGTSSSSFSMIDLLFVPYGLWWFYRAFFALSAQSGFFCLLLLIEGALVMKLHSWLSAKMSKA